MYQKDNKKLKKPTNTIKTKNKQEANKKQKIKNKNQTINKQ